jgi:dihydrofolate reductase
MRKITSFMHVSLDGFVAGTKGEMNWIKVDEEIFDYVGNITDHSDTALYGRITYEMMEGYWPTAADQPNASRHDIHHSQWYKNVEKVVVSHTMQGQKIPKTRIVGENLAAQIKELKQQQGKDIVIFGSPSASHSLMQLDLVDEFRLFVNPILLGAGVPLFKGIKERVKLKLLDTKTFASGVIGVHYEKV